MRAMITGISGTLGQAVSKILLDHGHEIIGFSKDEKRQAEIKPHPRLTLVLGCIRDQRRVLETSRGCDMIFHFAAMKRVEMAEANPEESIDTNLEGTRNVLGAQRQNRIPRVVLSSTDKACKPINVYGYCKALSEKLVLRNQNNVVVRYGNVLASNGSAIVDFIRKIQKGEQVNITDKNMTRFFMTIDEAANFVVRSALETDGGLKIYRDMKACYMTEIVDVLCEMIGKNVPMNVSGIRPGEKYHEDLYHEQEAGEALNSLNAKHFSRDELKALLAPAVERHAV